MTVFEHAAWCNWFERF